MERRRRTFIDSIYQNPLISSQKLRIRRRIGRAKPLLDKYLKKFYKVENIKELTKDQYLEALANLRTNGDFSMAMACIEEMNRLFN